MCVRLIHYRIEEACTKLNATRKNDTEMSCAHGLPPDASSLRGGATTFFRQGNRLYSEQNTITIKMILNVVFYRGMIFFTKRLKAIYVTKKTLTRTSLQE